MEVTAHLGTEEGGAVVSSAARLAPGGCIDSYGFSQAACGWVVIGWMSRLHDDRQEWEINLHFAHGVISGRCFRASFERGDLPGSCEGVVLLSSHGGRNLGRLVYIEIEAGDRLHRLFATEQVEQLPDAQIGARARSILGTGQKDAAHLAILKSLSRQGYAGRTTLHELGAPIHMTIDEVIGCGDAGTLLIGWAVIKAGALRRVRLRAATVEREIELSAALRVRREDVTEAVARDHGLHEPNAGIVLLVPDVSELDETAHLQIETADLSVGYLALPTARLRGVPAMRRILETFSLRYDEMVRAYNAIVGPAVAGINKERLSIGVKSERFRFGPEPERPGCSVIVPLYGRIDFMEYQLALFSREPRNRAHEFLYVLDDPALKTPLLALAETCLARFGLGFQVLVLDRNVGYAPASNEGLRHARGTNVCFLNSDVFPGEDRWIDRLSARLAADPSLGVVGPILLFEDGTVQHRGLTYERLPEFGNWLFPMHPGKGMRPPRRRGLERQQAITGACVMMRRETVEACGGFDESFAIGDFEDSDLCLRARALGFHCAVDLDVRLYHLERQSQSDMSHSWRFNLTLFNAWTHQNRWQNVLGLVSGED